MPSFSLIEERSENGHPWVKVSFPDSSSDFLVLRKYDGLDGHFIGHLRDEPEACVAMVHHPEHTEITLMSERAVGSTMYKWNKSNGEVELIPEVNFSNGVRRDITLNEFDSDEVVYDQRMQNKLAEIEKYMTADQAASVPATAKLQIKVGHSLIRRESRDFAVISSICSVFHVEFSGVVQKFNFLRAIIIYIFFKHGTIFLLPFVQRGGAIISPTRTILYFSTNQKALAIRR